MIDELFGLLTLPKARTHIHFPSSKIQIRNVKLAIEKKKLMMRNKVGQMGNAHSFATPYNQCPLCLLYRKREREGDEEPHNHDNEDNRGLAQDEKAVKCEPWQVTEF